MTLSIKIHSFIGIFVADYQQEYTALLEVHRFIRTSNHKTSSDKIPNRIRTNDKTEWEWYDVGRTKRMMESIIERMSERMSEWSNNWINERKKEREKEWTNEWMKELREDMKERLEEWRRKGSNEWMNKRTNEWMDEGRNKWMNKWMDAIW